MLIRAKNSFTLACNNLRVAAMACALLLFSCTPLSAQRQNDHWYFGNKAGINFGTGTPVSLTNGELLSIESCATVSDPLTGSLLFYSNGQNIWNAQHRIMPNGDGLLGGALTSATQGTVIVPDPGNGQLFYLFTADETISGAGNGFRYSVIDMRLDNGLGDVVPGKKNILVQTNTTERIAVARHGNGKDLWIVIHERNNDVFKSFLLSKTGLSTTPVVSRTGSVHQANAGTGDDQTMGSMKFNHSFLQLAVALYTANRIELFDFDPCTGIISSPRNISTLDHPYGLEFSPDNSKLYYSMYYTAGFNGAVYQTDLGNSALTPVLVGLSGSINFQSTGALQLAPDGLIYMAVNSESWLSAITNPNSSGISCGFVDQYITLQRTGLFPQPSLLGLPYPVVYPDSNSRISGLITANDSCLNRPVQLSISNSTSAGRIKWEITGNGGLVDTSTLLNPVIRFTTAGTYTIRALIRNNCSTDTLIRILNIYNCDSNNLPCDIALANVFTPDQDGFNDLFKVIITCRPEHYRLRIYNRWGENLFQSHTPDVSWNGRVENSGPVCPEGSYFYNLEYTLPGKPAANVTGAVTLIRGRN